MDDKIVDITKYEFYKNDVLDLKCYPNNDNGFLTRKDATIIDLSSLTSQEFKAFIKCFIEENVFDKNVKYIARLKALFLPLNIFLRFLCERNPDIKSLLTREEEKMKDDYIEWLQSNNIRYTTSNKRDGIVFGSNFTILHRIYLSEIKYQDRNVDFWEREVWDMDELNLSKERINKTDPVYTLSFTDIKNKVNKHYLKMYCKHLVGGTNYTLSTIKGKYLSAKDFIMIYDDKNLDMLSANDIVKYYEFLEEKHLGNKVYNTNVCRVSEFLQHLLAKKVVKMNLIAGNWKPKYSPRHYKLSSVKNDIINQIFNVLDKVDEKLRLMFLINYCTGYRVSDICGFELNCLCKSQYTNKDGSTKQRYYVQIYDEKLKKYKDNSIPLVLYELIYDRIKYVGSYAYKEKYLFNSENAINEPYRANTCRDKLQTVFIELGVKNEDGTPYIYKPHDFRHTYASDMVDLDIPFEVIRRMMHHVSPEMTLYYTEISARKEIEVQRTFINNLGEKIIFANDIELGDAAQIEWLRKNINAQMLPNGFCGLPVKMGNCDAGNACLDCTKFRTDETFMDVHKQQLLATEQILQKAKKELWEAQIVTNEKLKSRLENIISALEEREQ